MVLRMCMCLRYLRLLRVPVFMLAAIWSHACMASLSHTCHRKGSDEEGSVDQRSRDVSRQLMVLMFSEFSVGLQSADQRSCGLQCLQVLASPSHELRARNESGELHGAPKSYGP